MAGKPDKPDVPASTAVPWAAIEAALRDLRYGVVQIVVQDGRVVQIEKTEKIRLR